MDMLQSKKFIGALIAALIAGVASYTGMDTEVIALLISPFLIYIGGQGLADIGKEKAKIEKE